jgi:hypothetical protein
MIMKLRPITCAIVSLFLLSSTASAKPAFMKQYAAYYKGSTPTCTTCHGTPPRLNAYGTALKGALKSGRTLTPAMFKACDAKAPKS